MTQDAIRVRKLRSLGFGELTAAGSFVVAGLVFGMRFAPADRLALWGALAPLVLIPVQAAVYWLRSTSWQDRPVPDTDRAWLRLARAVNPVLLVAGAVVVVVAGPTSVGVWVLTVGVLVFGVLEYLNYFVVRLAYPPTQWFSRVTQWRTPQLVQDLRRSEAS